jgi:hypothetical protein
LPALEHHTCREDDVEEGGIKIKKTKKDFLWWWRSESKK